MKTLLKNTGNASLAHGADYSPSLLADLEEAEIGAGQTHQFSVPSGLHGQRLDQILAARLNQHSRNRLQIWIKEGRLTVDGVVVDEPKKKAFAGQQLVLQEKPDEALSSAQPENIPLEVVFEDLQILVINKPAGLVVHPGSGNWQGTLLNALLFHYPDSVNIPRAGIVHRLDKDTSGLMVVAKTLTAQTDLVRQLQARTVKRQYLALVTGCLNGDGVVDAPIGRHPSQRTKMAVVQNGKPAVTHYRVLQKFDQVTWVECSLETGRTHQIRVHMAHLGHPLVGDPVYGKTARQTHLPFARQALHATRLGLVHPVTGENLRWVMPIPADMAALLANAGTNGA